MQIWRPVRGNRVDYGGVTAMIGGPAPRIVPEHAHADLQITVRFGRAREVELVEPGEPHAGGWSAGVRVAVVQLAPALLAEAVDDLVRGRCAVRSGRHDGDGLLRAVGRALFDELACPHAALDRRLFFESTGLALAGHVVRTYGEVRSYRRRPGELDRRELATVCELVDASLDRALGVAEMAGAVGLAPRTFAERFRRTTGVAPYGYMLARRIERAKRLLRRRHLAIAEIALATGFASQSHFTAVFARRVGIAPARWRRAITA